MSKVEILIQNEHPFLWIDGDLWMWDIPVEQKMQKRIADQAFGKVLVAGYGLGIVQRFLVQNPEVSSTTTIEIQPKVLELCKKHYGEIHGIAAVGDFYRDLFYTKYDCIIGDIWADIIPDNLSDYKVFKEKALTLLRPGGKIMAWGAEYYEYLIEKEKK